MRFYVFLNLWGGHIVNSFDTIFCQPVRSSGDVYHIASYLIACRALGKEIPQVILFYDTDDTKIQANRGVGFLEALGFNESYSLEFTSTCYQAKARLKKSAEAVRAYSDAAVDQKMTTSLLSFMYLKYSNFITSKIFMYFENISLQLEVSAAFNWAQKQIKECNAALKLSENKFVILNLRSAAGANDEQIISLQQFKTISKLLAKNNYNLIVLDVGSTNGAYFANLYKNTPYTKNVVIKAFPNILNLDDNYQKLPHIFLLMQLSKYAYFSGVIGNTSGTLDIAAFMGLRTLCIHRFKNTSKNNILIPYQDLRILLQANMMSVFDFAERLFGLEKMIEIWLNSKQHFLCHNFSQAENISIEQIRFAIEHFDRKHFALNANGENVNHIFKTQFQQISLDQRLSQSLNLYIEEKDKNTNAIKFNQSEQQQLIFTQNARGRSGHSRDDIDIKTISRGHRKSTSMTPPTYRL